MKRLALTASTLALALTASFAGPAEDREAFMKENGKLLGQLAPVAKGEKPFDAAEVKSLLEAFNAHTQKLDVVALFPEGTGGRPTRADPAIWENFDDFKAKAEDLKMAASAAAQTNPQNPQELGAQVASIGGKCQACHEKYRLPEN